MDSCSDADNCNIDEYQESDHNTEFGVSYNENAIKKKYILLKKLL